MNDNKKYNISFVAVAIIFSIIVMSIYAMYFSKEIESTKEQFIEIATNSNLQVKKNTENWLNRQLEFIDSMANDKIVIDACLNPEDDEKRNLAYEYLEKRNIIYDDSETISLVSFKSKDFYVQVKDENVLIKDYAFFVGSKDNGVVGKAGIDRSYIKAIYNGNDVFISEVYKSIFRSQPIFVITKAIKQDGITVGAIAIAPSMERYSANFIDSVKYGESGYMFVVDENLEIITHPEKSQILLGQKSNEEIRKIATKAINKIDVFEEIYIKEKKIYVSTEITSFVETKNNWFAISTIPRYELLNKVATINSYLLPIVIMALSLIIMLLDCVKESSKTKDHSMEIKVNNENIKEDLKELERMLKDKKNRDGLTGLINHNIFFENLEEAVQQGNGNPFTLVLLDFDDFKNINTTFGHHIGDEVIIKLASTVKQNTRGTDISTRYGGEGVLIMLIGAGVDDAIEKAEYIRRIVQNTEYSEAKLKTTISVGVTAWNGESVIELIRRADDLMLKAKEAGRNNVVSG